MNKLLLFACCFTFSISIFAQTAELEGVVKDAISEETLIQATVRVGDTGTEGTVTDIDGNYSLSLSPGSYEIVVSYVGYQTQRTTVTLSEGVTVLNFKLEEESIVMNEVQVVADVARSRETPVAFSTIPQAKIEEEISVQDLPMVLNSTPGVYATQQGGGDGDARINIRGFKQRNVAVMIDGIPINDMENGRVFWSNWSGLSEVTRSMQVQRGLGASKLAIPSIGGTINVLTKGIESKRRFTIKQEVGTYGYLKTSLSATTGRLKNGWGLTFAGSYKRGDGWVDNTWTRAWFYFGKIEKQMGDHLLSLSAVGAPQEHGQHNSPQRITVYDLDYGIELGIDTSQLDQDFKDEFLQDRGVRFNPGWGNLDRYQIIDGDTLFAGEEVETERYNFYHKPQITLKHFWSNPSNKVSLSNIAYLSVGRGGGVQSDGGGFDIDDATGQIDFQTVWAGNCCNPLFVFLGDSAARNILRSANNEHIWYGLLSTIDYKINDNLTFAGGLDLRYYKGLHYSKIHDLLGGPYYFEAQNSGNLNAPNKNDTLVVDDRYDWNNDGIVKWGGAFTQLEYKKDKLSAFVNISGSASHYKRIDYFLPKDIVLEDTTFVQAVGYERVFIGNGQEVLDTLFYEGQAYTINSPESEFTSTSTDIYPSFTAKLGANYNINRTHNVFFNLGYISKAPLFNNVINNRGQIYEFVENESVQAIEVGYGIKSPKFASNLNLYYTIWNNRPVTKTCEIDGDPFPCSISGLDALHRGIELDFAYKILNNLQWEGLVSFGDWVWNSEAVIQVAELGIDATEQFDATGVHVGDAAQVQLASSIRYEPIRGLYLKPQFTYFGKNYADFNPDDLQGDNERREVWQLPNYHLLDIHAGYSFSIGKNRLQISATVLNVLGTKYISDARKARFNSGFEAQHMEVYMGQGRRASTSVKLTF